MKIPVKEILEIPILMDLFICKEGENDKPYRLLFNEVTDISPEEYSKDGVEVFFSKAAESEDGLCFLTLAKKKPGGGTETQIVGEYIYPVNHGIVKRNFTGVLADFVNIFAI